jgi:hypothetical protein
LERSIKYPAPWGGDFYFYLFILLGAILALSGAREAATILFNGSSIGKLTLSALHSIS